MGDRGEGLVRFAVGVVATAGVAMLGGYAISQEGLLEASWIAPLLLVEGWIMVAGWRKWRKSDG